MGGKEMAVGEEEAIAKVYIGIFCIIYRFWKKYI
jgi:hypothetical protein